MNDRRHVPGHGQVLSVVGPLTHSTAPALREHLRDSIDSAARGSCPNLLVDMSCCTDIDVDGLLALAVAQNAARTRGGDLHVTAVPPLVERQLRQHNLEHLLAEAGADDQEPSAEDPTRVPGR